MAPNSDIEFRMLGPLEVRVNGQLVDTGPRRGRVVLCLLLLNSGRSVHIDRLIELAWYGAHPSRTARNAIQICISRLRSTLGGLVSISTIGDGYQLDVDPRKVDLHLFRALVADARYRDGKSRVDTLREAELLWRGPLLAGTFGQELRDHFFAGIDEERMVAVEDRLDAQLQLGMHTELVGELTELTQANPARERLVELHLLALYRAGRKADALAAYQRMRKVLATELGLDPTPRLQALQRAILTDDPELAPPAEAPAPIHNRVALLPWDIPDFTGRRAQLQVLDDLAANRGSASTVVISTISGIGGVGKTALAVRWAHRAAGRFPDGHIYINLHGYDRRRPLKPAEALGQILRALGVQPERIPSDVDEAAGLYRSTLADRKILVLLDNAGTVEQVRPLLPSGKDNFVLVTSRDRLAGLISHDGAKRLYLDTLTPEESTDLLASIIGADRVRAEPAPAALLTEATGHLPLALRIAAATLADQPHQTIAAYVAKLIGPSRLSQLAVEGDHESSVRATFDCSYQALPPGHQRMFRLVGLAPGPNITVAAAAALAQVSDVESARLLAQLAQAHLVTEQRPGRYAMHDLIKDYAHEMAMAVDVASAQVSLQQLYGHYLLWMDRAARTAYPNMLRLPTAYGAKDVFSSQPEALAWFDAELPNLVATARRAAEDHDHRTSVLIADGMRGYLSIRRHFPEWLSVAHIALACAESSDDRAGQIMARLSLSQASWWLGQRAEAIEMLLPAVELAGEISWHDASAALLGNLGAIYGDWGRASDGAEYLRMAIDIYDRHGTPALSAANNLTNLGAICNDTGKLAEATLHHSKAMRLYHDMGAQLSAAVAESNLGAVLLQRGDFASALTHLTSALTTLRESGESAGEAGTLIELARAHHELGDNAAATTYAERGLAIAMELGADRRVALATSVLGLITRNPDRHEDALQQTTGSHYVQCLVLIAQGRTLHELGRYADAATASKEALRLARELSFRSLEGAALSWLAEISAAAGEAAQAIGYATEAIAIHKATGVDGLLARTTTLVDQLARRSAPPPASALAD